LVGARCGPPSPLCKQLEVQKGPVLRRSPIWLRSCLKSMSSYNVMMDGVRVAVASHSQGSAKSVHDPSLWTPASRNEFSQDSAGAPIFREQQGEPCCFYGCFDGLVCVVLSWFELCDCLCLSYINACFHDTSMGHYTCILVTCNMQGESAWTRCQCGEHIPFSY
jgi:hypothetical protein